MRLTLHVTAKDYAVAMFLPPTEHPRLRALNNIIQAVKILFILAAIYFLIESCYQLIFRNGRISLVFLWISVVILLSWSCFFRKQLIYLESLRASNYRFTSECEINADFIHYKNDLGEVKFQWDSFSNWIENRSLFLLYPAKNQLCFAKWKENKDSITLIPPANNYDIFPKHCFPSEQAINDFRQLLTEKIGQRGGVGEANLFWILKSRF